ncbi:MAG: HDOD domain-containing protein [Deltaproteobacteria bacterium]|nr:HDOD domain-containing protein [Deltaproteobacteria bacterium]
MSGFTPSSTTYRLRPAANAQRLQNSSEHAREGWFPVNQEIFTSIKEKIETQHFQGEAGPLVDEIKRDQALLGHCISRLTERGARTKAIANPVQSLKDIPYATLVEWVSVPATRVSPYRLEAASKNQMQRLREAALSCRSTEVLAEGAQINADLAFSCAFLRQLGLNLIAWNYPSHFRRAQQAAQAGEEIDKAIERILGIRPSDLSAQIAKDWQLSSQLMSTLTDGAASPGLDSAKLRKVCEVGETYARLCDPAQHESAQKAWQDLKETAREYLGRDVEQRLSEESSYITELFKFEIVEENKFGEPLYAKNAFANRCPSELRQSIQRVYERISPSGQSTEAIQELAASVIPQAGFMRGCIYLARSGTFDFVPVLKLGDQPLSYYSLKNSAARSGIAQALLSSVPIRQDASWFGEDEVAVILGTIGGAQHQAVLYLEFNAEARNENVQSGMLYFKAIRQAFNDCLNI